MKRNARVDENQKEIVSALRNVGCYVLHLHQVKNAFDILIFWRGETWCCEIKSDKQPPSKQRLTEGENLCKSSMEAVGVSYHVVKNPQEALRLVRAIE